MRLSILKILWRQILADKANSLVSITGLSIAIAVSVLVGAMIDVQLGSSRGVPDANRVYRFEFKNNVPEQESDWVASTSFAVWKNIKDSKVPGTFARFMEDQGRWIKTDSRWSKLTFAYADPEIVEIFGMQAIKGDINKSLTRPDSAAITLKGALSLFGSEDVIGKSITVDGKSVQIVALLPTPLVDSPLHYEVLVPQNSVLSPDPDRGLTTNYFRLAGYVWMKLERGVNPLELTSIAQASLDALSAMVPPSWVANGRKLGFYRLVSLEDFPLSAAENKTKVTLIKSATAVALAIVLLAMVNFVNLTTIRTLQRQKEIALRKLLGAGLIKLLYQFFLETFTLVFISTVIGFLLAWMVAPLIEEMTQVNLLAHILMPRFIVLSFLMCAVLSILGSAYPTWVATSVRAAQALSGKGKAETKSGFIIRKILTVFQFTAALILLATSIVVIAQIQHGISLKYGFNAKDLLAIDLPETASESDANNLLNAVKNEFKPQNAAIVEDIPTRNNFTRIKSFHLNGGNEVSARVIGLTKAYVETFEIPILSGQLPKESDNDGVVVDKIFVRSLGITEIKDAINKTIIVEGKSYYIRAVVDAVRMESLRQTIQAKVYMPLAQLKDDTFSNIRVLLVRNENITQMVSDVASLWPRFFPNSVYETSTVHSIIKKNFQNELFFSQLIIFGSAISLLLAGCGIYALSSYTVVKKTKEIILRKLCGASGSSIVKLLGREFGSLIFFAILIGIPISIYIALSYQSDIVERADVNGWAQMMAIAGLILLAICATTANTIKALRLRPIEVLKD